MGNQQPSQKTYNIDKINEILNEYKSGKTIKSLSKQYDLPYSTIQTWITKYKCNRPSKIRYKLENEPELAETLYQLYHVEDKTMTEIAKLTGFSTRNKVKIAFDYFKIPTTKKTITSKLTKDVLYKLYVEQNLSQLKIGEKYGITASLVNRLLKRYEITKDLTPKQYTEIGKTLLNDKNKFQKFLIENQNKYTVEQLSQLCGCNFGTIYSRFKQWNIEYRPYIVKALSSHEQKAYDLLFNKYNVFIDIQNRNIIKPYELDFWIPDFNIAIEINGYHTHCEPNFANKTQRTKLSQNYHQNKSENCSIKNVQLIHIWEHDIENICEIVENVLKQNIESELVNADQFNRFALLNMGYKIIEHIPTYMVIKNGNVKIVKNENEIETYDYVIKNCGYWKVQRL